MKRFFVLLLAVTVLACQTSKKEKVIGLLADSAMVVSAHPLASQVGVEIMKKGGNGVDAAIATQFGFRCCLSRWREILVVVDLWLFD
ncbi:MAG: hypothetical protein U5K54_09835 [Cytophagales bacterium]|nr:hypothetical protein [Cytophagales bacterium]